MERDIVMVLGKDSGRETGELRYALRGLDAFVPHSRLVILGYMPNFVTNAVNVPFLRENKWIDLHDKFMHMAEMDLTPEVIYTEDDYIVTKPLVNDELPNYYKDTLEERKELAKGHQGGHWAQTMTDTHDVLLDAGIPHPISFDMHIPMVVRRSEIPVHLQHPRPLRPRTLYGNVCSDSPKRFPRDVKATTVEALNDILGLDLGFLSTADNSWSAIGVEAHLRKLFPTKSKYER